MELLYNEKHPLRVFESFAGYGSQSVALQRLKKNFPGFNYKVVGISEVEMNALAAYRAIHGTDIPNYGSITDIEWDKVPDFDLFTYSFPCFVAGTLILTTEGYKPIEQIQVGDKVLTHNNRYCSVEVTGSKLATTLYHVKPMMGNDIYCTANHPFLVRKRYRYGHKRVRMFTNPEWVEAKDLKDDMFLGFAINQKSEYPTWNGSNADRWGNRINHLLPLFTNGYFWYLMGRYVGDGWKKKNKNGRGIVICCSDRNEDTLVQAFKKCGFHYCKVVQRTVYKYFVCMNELEDFVTRYGYYATGKRIDAETMNLPTNMLEWFIKGYVESDGCYCANEWKITSASRELLLGMSMCIAKCYHTHVRMYSCHRPPKCVIEGRTVNQHDTWSIAWHTDKRKQDKAFYEDGYVWFPMKKPVETIAKNATVYNMQVADDHSYTANGVIVHNCQSISNAGLQKGLEEGSGTRSSLLWECRKAIVAKHPKYLLMENVKALLSKRFLPFFLKWLGELENYGYSSYYQVLNAASYGVPQHRERVFCVSILNDGSNQTFTFPKPFPLEKRLKDVLEDHADEKYYLTDKALAYFQRTGADPSHDHKFKPKKKTTSPSPSDAKQEAALTTTSSTMEWSTDSRVASLMQKIVSFSQEELEALYHDLGLMLDK